MSRIEAIYYEEGRVVPTGNNWQYEYTLTNHLGNARVSFADLNNNGSIDTNTTTSDEILQTQSYYPFGLTHSGTNNVQVGSANLYQYNGKELQSELGWSDYGFRMYDTTVGRWITVDPLADDPEQVDKSPYAFTWNNPINLTDPDGRKVKPKSKRELNLIRKTISKSERKYVKRGIFGNINKRRLNRGINKLKTKGENFKSLHRLVNSKRTYKIEISSEFKYKDKKGNIKSGKLDPLPGTVGISLLKGENGEEPISGKNEIYVAETADEKEKVVTIAHELGHALFYDKKEDGEEDFNPAHEYDNYNEETETYEPSNLKLENWLKDREKEAEKNYDD